MAVPEHQKEISDPSPTDDTPFLAFQSPGPVPESYHYNPEPDLYEVEFLRRLEANRQCLNAAEGKPCPLHRPYNKAELKIAMNRRKQLLRWIEEREEAEAQGIVWGQSEHMPGIFGSAGSGSGGVSAFGEDTSEPEGATREVEGTEDIQSRLEGTGDEAAATKQVRDNGHDL